MAAIARHERCKAWIGALNWVPLAIVRVTAADERKAREIIAQYDDKDFSLTDAVSFAIAERLGISYAISFDHHFGQYGLILLNA